LHDLLLSEHRLVAFGKPLKIGLVVRVGGVEGDEGAVGEAVNICHLPSQRGWLAQFVHDYNSEDAENELADAF